MVQVHKGCHFQSGCPYLSVNILYLAFFWLVLRCFLSFWCANKCFGALRTYSAALFCVVCNPRCNLLHSFAGAGPPGQAPVADSFVCNLRCKFTWSPSYYGAVRPHNKKARPTKRMLFAHDNGPSGPLLKNSSKLNIGPQALYE